MTAFALMSDFFENEVARSETRTGRCYSEHFTPISSP